MVTEDPWAPQQGTVLHGKKGFQNRLQSTAGCAIGTVQSDRLFPEFKVVVSNGGCLIAVRPCEQS
jgi:hypothetical protein